MKWVPGKIVGTSIDSFRIFCISQGIYSIFVGHHNTSLLNKNLVFQYEIEKKFKVILDYKPCDVFFTSFHMWIRLKIFSFMPCLDQFIVVLNKWGAFFGYIFHINPNFSWKVGFLECLGNFFLNMIQFFQILHFLGVGNSIEL